jgi:ribose 1,5-bisphosphokinase
VSSDKRARGRGALVYVMGPSGAGKDTLLKYARHALSAEATIFAHRYVTRPPAPGDDNSLSLSEAEFETRVRFGLFRFVWEAHGWRYGVGREIDLWRDAGLAVVVSGSRAHFAAQAAELGDAWPVLVTAPKALIAERLASRGRESAAEIEERLSRAADVPVEADRLVTIENSGSVEDAGERLVAFLRRL